VCLVLIIRYLFRIDSQSLFALFFHLETFFSRFTIIFILLKHLIAADINNNAFSSHSFKKSVAQHASDYDMLDENIQRLGR
jgi:hypothetical protein